MCMFAHNNRSVVSYVLLDTKENGTWSRPTKILAVQSQKASQSSSDVFV